MDAVVFIIDVSDLNRIREARDELNGLLADECIAQCPIMILGNKIDKAGALSEVQLKHFLGLQDDCTGKVNFFG